jgi:hypothetical protein
MSFTFTWNGDRLKSDWERAAQVAINAVTKHAVERCQLAVSNPYPPASTPGEGTGRDAIVAIRRPNRPIPTAELTVRRSGRYMLLLEIGTRFIAPRPWLQPTLIRYHRELEQIGNTTFRQALGQ